MRDYSWSTHEIIVLKVILKFGCDKHTLNVFSAGDKDLQQEPAWIKLSVTTIAFMYQEHYSRAQETPMHSGCTCGGEGWQVPKIVKLIC